MMQRHRNPNLFTREYAVFRREQLEFFRGVLAKAPTVLDPMCGTAPLIPDVEEFKGRAFFNDLLPCYYYVNRAKTYSICRAIRRLEKRFPGSCSTELHKCLKSLHKLGLVSSDNWIDDAVVKAFLTAWHRTSAYNPSMKTFLRAAIILCIRPYSCVSTSNMNCTWYRPGGMTTARDLKVIVQEVVDRFYTFYDSVYSNKLIKGGGKLHFGMDDANTIMAPWPVDVIITSPPYPNRTDYRRIFAPELYFLSHLNRPRRHNGLDTLLLGTTKVRDYVDFEQDLIFLARHAPLAHTFVNDVSERQPFKANGRSWESDYYPKCFTRYYAQLFKTFSHLLELLTKNGVIYIVVQNNIHRGVLNAIADYIIEFFCLMKCRARVINSCLHSHQGLRNISEKHPIVLHKHVESLIEVRK